MKQMSSYFICRTEGKEIKIEGNPLTRGPRLLAVKPLLCTDGVDVLVML
jgi:hypothetical protein